MLKTMTFAAVVTMLATASALAQGASSPAGTGPLAPKPAAAAPLHAAPTKPAAVASTPESRSAAALALSHEPTYDEGTAQRIREAALSYSDLAVRGGWPAIPPDARFAIGVAGPHDELLRRRLLISGGLASGKTSGPPGDKGGGAVEGFQGGHR